MTSFLLHTSTMRNPYHWSFLMIGLFLEVIYDSAEVDTSNSCMNSVHSTHVTTNSILSAAENMIRPNQ